MITCCCVCLFIYFITDKLQPSSYVIGRYYCDVVASAILTSTQLSLLDCLFIDCYSDLR